MTGDKMLQQQLYDAQYYKQCKAIEIKPFYNLERFINK